MFDLETTFPSKDVPSEIIEFGCLLLSRSGFHELASFGTLIRPTSSRVDKRSTDCNGITSAMLATSPTFPLIAPTIHAFLHNRVWVGHNIRRFDMPIITAAFTAVDLTPPTCLGTIDTLDLCRTHFNNRAGNNKLASLALHFGLGEEKHRAVSDCRQTVEALKGMALTLWLEREVPDLFPAPVIAPRVYAKKEKGGEEEKKEEEEHKGEGTGERKEGKAAGGEEKDGVVVDAKTDAPPSTAQPSPSTPAKRGRGRPRKSPLPTPSTPSTPSTPPSLSAVEQLMGALTVSDGGTPLPPAPSAAVNGEDAVGRRQEEVEESEEEVEVEVAYAQLHDEDDGGGEEVKAVGEEVKGEEEGEGEHVAAPPSAQRRSSAGGAMPHALIAILDRATSAPPLHLSFLYASSPDSRYASVWRELREVEWADRPYSFFALFPPRAGEDEAGPGTKLKFTVSKVTGVRGDAAWGEGIPSTPTATTLAAADKTAS